MEIASDELITEAEKQRARDAVAQLCLEVKSEFSEAEAEITARAIFHDAVSAAAKNVAVTIAADSVPMAKEILSSMLKNSSQHPFVEEAVLEAVQPIAHQGALAAVRRWSQEKAMPQAHNAAKEVFQSHIENGYQALVQTAVLAGIRLIIANRVSSGNSQVSAAEREKLVEDYMNSEAKKAATEAVAKALTAEIRREAQAAAEHAVEEIAAQATDAVAREEALSAARVVAMDTAKAEISRLVLAEAQRRAARLARERLQETAPNQEEGARAEFCQDEAKKIAEEAVQSVTEEIADPSVADLDLVKAKELALSAASAVAREFSGAYQMTVDEEITTINTKTIVFLLLQIILGIFIVWFFLLGGYEACQPGLKKILPPRIYHSIYTKPVLEPSGTGKNVNEVDDLLDDSDQPKGINSNAGKSKEIDDVPAVKPESTVPSGLRDDGSLDFAKESAGEAADSTAKSPAVEAPAAPASSSSPSPSSSTSPPLNSSSSPASSVPAKNPVGPESSSSK